jgi:hypothetical protein
MIDLNRCYGISLFWEAVIFIVLTTITYILDPDKCSEGNIPLYLHHALNVFVYIGWLSNNKTVLDFYLLVPFAVVFQWILNSNKCPLTEMHQETCKTTNEFQDVFYLMGKRCGWEIYFKILIIAIGYTVVLLKLGHLNVV